MTHSDKKHEVLRKERLQEVRIRWDKDDISECLSVHIKVKVRFVFKAPYTNLLIYPLRYQL